MASALVGGALLDATFETLFGIITSAEFRGFIRNKKLNVSLVDELETRLLTLQAVLNDAEQKQITDPAVKQWLDRLKDAIHDAEDLLDEINTEALRRKIEAEHDSNFKKVGNFLSSYRQRTNSKLRSLCQRLKLFAKQKNDLGLQHVPMIVSQRTPTSSLLNEQDVVGRDDDREELMKLLLSDDPNGSNIGVITIFGMGGVGKTALAQLLYNDHRVDNHFDEKAWTCISEAFDATMVTKSLLESIASKSYESHNLDFLQKELSQMLKDKKYLFVLDDLWNNKYNDWDGLRAPFRSGKQGSRIIITTRQNDVARMTHTFPVHHLKPLPNEDCWLLLAKHAFENEDLSRYLNLEAIGRKIAEKCDGLPIAAKALGGILRSRVDENYWNNILISNLWDLRNDDVLPALRLSYLYLPANLKRCFAYCSIFPKDYALDKKHVVLLWMTEGLLEQCQNKSMEQIGDEYFDELLSRSLIQQVKGNFVMHDLVNDLATIIYGKSCSRLENSEISENVRHLSYCKETYDSRNKFKSCYALRCLRTFLPLPLSSDSWRNHYLTEKVTHDFLPRQKFLRVLSLATYKNITKLSNSIGNLIHLRFLDLSYTPIRRLPDAVCKLYNLQTLRLLCCYCLTELPTSIGKLVNLRHLEMSGTNLWEMPREITNLQNLQTLTVFVVSKQPDGLRLSDLRCFPNLQGKLSVLGLRNVIDAMDASEANLKNKGLIEELEFDWVSAVSEDSQIETDVSDRLQPSTNLRKLTINCYGGTRFPRWLGDFSFVNIAFLRISGCDRCVSLPPLGQLPSLKTLEVLRMKSVKTIGADFYGSCSSSFQPFPSLVSLQFGNMSEWEEWLPFTGDGIEFPFPCLKELSLHTCHKLRGYLPQHLPSSLTNVKINGCNQLEASTLGWITSIESLSIYDGGPHLFSLLENDSQNLLRYLSVTHSDSLTSVPKMVLSSNHIRSLYLRDISSLTSFPTEGLPTLQLLRIIRCGNLKFQTNETWYNYTSLQDLIIRDSCHSLTSFPLGSFPALKNLILSNCPNLKSISISDDVSVQSLSCLETLDLQCCPNLESFPQGGLLTPNLSKLSIDTCEKLASLPEQIGTLVALQNLKLQNLENLASFPQGGLLPPNLSILSIDICKKFASLPEQIGTLTALQNLQLWNLENLASFPQGGLPPNLRSLEIEISPMAIGEWGFQLLTCLSKCQIGGDDLVNALLKVTLLPTSLVSLTISSLDNLKFLDGRGIQRLRSLEELHIEGCRSLESLPEDRLPSSLKLLRISHCPLLKARYQSQRGKHLAKIARIPAIQIHGDVII